jgi:hypothetical protein
MNIQLIVVIAYLMVLFATAVWAARLVRRGREGFLLASRNLPAPLIACTLTGLAIGGHPQSALPRTLSGARHWGPDGIASPSQCLSSLSLLSALYNSAD